MIIGDYGNCWDYLWLCITVIILLEMNWTLSKLKHLQTQVLHLHHMVLTWDDIWFWKVMNPGKGVNSVVIRLVESVLENELCVVLVPAQRVKVPNCSILCLMLAKCGKGFWVSIGPTISSRQMWKTEWVFVSIGPCIELANVEKKLFWVSTSTVVLSRQMWRNVCFRCPLPFCIEPVNVGLFWYIKSIYEFGSYLEILVHICCHVVNVGLWFNKSALSIILLTEKIMDFRMLLVSCMIIIILSIYIHC